MIGASLKPNYDAIKWVDDDELFEAWCEGRTGYPVVDAAMMQMNTTGKAREFESQCYHYFFRIYAQPCPNVYLQLSH